MNPLTAALHAVRERLQRAEKAAGRRPGEVTLVAVSKTKPEEDVVTAAAAGQLDFGENYAQELRDKRAALLSGHPTLRWHFIGPLQTNKVKYVAGTVALVHTLDSADLLDELERRMATAPNLTGPQRCLVQVNVAGEAQKRGVSPDALPALLDHFARTPHLLCEGLMLIPPHSDDPEGARPHFAALRRLRDEQALVSRPQVQLRALSMGMSHDLEVAVAEGATLVRVGTAIFGARSRPKEKA